MAKTATVTVNVNAQQFNQFLQNFNAFSARLTSLNTSFQQINQTIQNTQKQSSALLNTMRSLYNVTTSLLKPITSITSHFLKWGTIIGGVTALLGMGGGLFGIERLANSILQKRRQVMGLGGNYGGTQASLIYGQSVLSNPASALQNIALGQAGDMDKLMPLMAMGIPFGSKDTPEDILNKILKRLPDILKNTDPNLRLPMLQAFGLDKIFTNPMDLLRITTEAGRKEIQRKIDLERAHAKELDLSEKAQQAWAEFDIQLKVAGVALEKILGEGLQDLAKPLSDLSEGFLNLVKVLMDTGIVKDILKTLTTWINSFAEYLKSDKLKKDLHDFGEEIKTWLPWLQTLGENLKQFGDILGNIVSVLQKIWGVVRWFDQKEKEMQELGRKFGLNAGGGGDGANALTPGGGGGYESITGNQPSSSGGNQSSTSSGTTSVTGGNQTTNTTNAGGNQTTNANQGAQGAQPGSPAFGFGGGYTAPSSQSIGTSSGNTSIGGSSNQQSSNLTGGSKGAVNLAASMGGNNRLSSPSMAFNTRAGGTALGNMTNLASNGGSFNQRFASASSAGGISGGTAVSSAGGVSNQFAMATQKAAPGGNAAFGVGVNANTNISSVGRGGRGPLSSDNWQSTRTAKLEIRNVPGSNVFMSGVGMSTA